MNRNFTILYKIIFAFFLISLYDFINRSGSFLTIACYILLLILLTGDLSYFVVRHMKKNYKRS